MHRKEAALRRETQAQSIAGDTSRMQREECERARARTSGVLWSRTFDPVETGEHDTSVHFAASKSSRAVLEGCDLAKGTEREMA